jgi:methanogenic corrinoid protein MtbC1
MTTSAPFRSLDDPGLFQQYLDLVGDGDEFGATGIALGLLGAGVPAQRIMVDLIGGTQAQVGELWAANEWSVAREHAATAVNERVLAALSAQLSFASGSSAGGEYSAGRRGRIALACVDGEWHGLPARILAELLRMDGWRVDFLGASVPGPHLITHLHQTGPDAVALSCMIPTRLPRAHAAITACRSAGIPVIAGGRGFGPGSRYAERLDADAWAGTAEEAVTRLATEWPPPSGPEFPTEYLGDEEYTHLVRSRPQLIETAMHRLAAAYPAVHHYNQHQLDSTIDDFGHIADFLAASLYIREPQVFCEFVQWTGGVLVARDVPISALRVGLRLVRDQLIDFPAATHTLDLALAELPLS